MIFFRKPKIVVDCFTVNQTVADCYPIREAREFMPDGFKKMPGHYDVRVYDDAELSIKQSTIKRCVGILNLFNSGFVIPSWSDFGIQVFPDGTFKWNAVFVEGMVSHTGQLWDSLYPGHTHIKVRSPWLIREKTGVNFTWNQCDWHVTPQMDSMRVISGVLDFKYQHSSHVNIFVRNGSLVEVAAGAPLVHLIPMSDRKIEMKHHVVTAQEYMRISRFSTTYMNFYRNTRDALEKAASKCPFGFSAGT